MALRLLCTMTVSIPLQLPFEVRMNVSIKSESMSNIRSDESYEYILTTLYFEVALNMCLNIVYFRQ